MFHQNNFFDFHCFYKVLGHLCGTCDLVKGDAWEGQNVNISSDLLQNRRLERVFSESAKADLAADVSKSWFSLVKNTVPTQVGWLAGCWLIGWLADWLVECLAGGWRVGWLAGKTFG